MAKKKVKVIAESVFPDIIKDSTLIRNYLLRRWDELTVNPKWSEGDTVNEKFILRDKSQEKLTEAQIYADAVSLGMKFTPASLNKYKKHGTVRNSLTQRSIIWLCARYGIPVVLHVGKLSRDPNNPKGVIWTYPPYNEKSAIEDLNSKFKN